MDRSTKLIDKLKKGYVLYKDHADYEIFDMREYLFMSSENTFEVRGWGTAYGTSTDRLAELITNPERWNVHTFNVSKGYPYPWSVAYKENKN